MLEAVLTIETMQDPQSNLEEKDSLSILKDIFFPKNRSLHLNSTRVIRPVKQNKLIFSSNKINKPIPAPIYSVS